MCSLNFICESSGCYKLCAFINWRSSKPWSIVPFSHVLSDHSHWYSSKTEEKHQVTVLVRAVCMHFPFLSLWPSFCSFFYSGIWPDGTCYFFIQSFLCEYALKILRHIISFWCFHPFQYWVALLKSIHEKQDNDFYMHKRFAVKYCIYISFFALYVIFFLPKHKFYVLWKTMWNCILDRFCHEQTVDLVNDL